MYVYILTDRYKGTLYIGVTNDLVRRVYEHREGAVDGFTKRYNLKSLVYFEQLDGAEQAITREKQLKKWNRDWKIELIEKINPEWKDLYETICP
jgi:putative endonuclease